MEVRPEVLDVCGVVFFARFLEVLALLVALEGGLVEVVVDGLVFLVVDEAVQDASLLGRILRLVALEELLLRSGEVNFPLERVFCLRLVARDGFRLQVHEVEVLVVLT